MPFSSRMRVGGNFAYSDFGVFQRNRPGADVGLRERSQIHELRLVVLGVNCVSFFAALLMGHLLGVMRVVRALGESRPVRGR
jgi:hypothetical protein